VSIVPHANRLGFASVLLTLLSAKCSMFLPESVLELQCVLADFKGTFNTTAASYNVIKRFTAIFFSFFSMQVKLVSHFPVLHLTLEI